MFQGRVRSVFYETVDGFTISDVHITNQTDDIMRVSVKNENLACWMNDTVFATIPDLICLFDNDTGAPIANPDCHTDQNVCVVILPAPAPFLSAAGLSSFGPQYAGINAEFSTPL